MYRKAKFMGFCLLQIASLCGSSTSSVVAGIPDTTYGTAGTGTITIKFDEYGSITSPFATTGPGGGGFNSDYFFEAVRGTVDTLNQRIVLTMTNEGMFNAIRLLADGSLDTTFGSNGKVLTYIPRSHVKYSTNANYAFASSMSAITDIQGRTVIAGFLIYDADFTTNLLLARYNYDGSLDTTFGDNGLVELAPRSLSLAYFPNQVITDYAGRYIIVGSQAQYKKNQFGTNIIDNRKFLVVRFNSDGSLDTTFADNGIFLYSVPKSLNSILRSIWVDNTFNYVIGGVSQLNASLINSSTSFAQFVIFRLTESGTIDTTFGKKGFIITLVSPPTAAIFQNIGIFTVVQDSALNLLAAGAGSDNIFGVNNAYEYPLVIRYANPNYDIDKTFGVNGRVKLTSIQSSITYINGLTTDLTDKIVGLSYNGIGAGAAYTIFRLLQNGQLDTSYGGNGTGMYTVNGLIGSRIYVPSLGIDSSGRSYVFHLRQIFGFPKSTGYFVITRYTSDYEDIFSGYGVQVGSGYGTGI